MPNFDRSLDVFQGFNFKKDKSVPVGYITKLKVGDITFTANLECKDPTAPTSNVMAVAVLAQYSWATGPTDAMYFSGQISVANKTELAGKLLGGLTDVSVEFNYVLYEYDPLQKKYFKSNFIDADVKGLLEKQGKDLNIAVADDPSTEVQSPLNFSLNLGIKSQSIAQSINLATSSTAKVVKQWGVKE